MNTFLETLKVRADEAQKRFAAAQQELQAAQAKLNVTTQEFSAWHHAYAAELAKEKAKNPPIDAQLQLPSASIPAVTNGNGHEGNKTDLVRELLQQNQTGMTPGEIWQRMEKQIGNRAYLYSVLMRLSDRVIAKARRGKYFVIPKVEEVQGQISAQ
jgi:hypothetical protein